MLAVFGDFAVVIELFVVSGLEEVGVVEIGRGIGDEGSLELVAERGQRQ